MISKENTRIVAIISKKDAIKLKEMAKKENRSVSSYVSTLIKNKISEEFKKHSK